MAVSIDVHCTRHSLWLCFCQAECHIASLSTEPHQGPRMGCLCRRISSRESRSPACRAFRPKGDMKGHLHLRTEKSKEVLSFREEDGRYNSCSEVWAQFPSQKMSALSPTDHLSQDKVLA